MDMNGYPQCSSGRFLCNYLTCSKDITSNIFFSLAIVQATGLPFFVFRLCVVHVGLDIHVALLLTSKVNQFLDQ